MTELIDIADFLPKYPYITDQYNQKFKNLAAYPDKSLEEALYTKKEFYDNRLDASESKPAKKGDLMRHQNIVARYMSIVTPYDGILLFHAMGSGKACSAIGIGEELRSRKKLAGSLKGMIFLARGPNILNNIAKELVYVCTDGRYIPEDLDKIKPEMRMAKIKRELGPFYRFYTIHQFVKIINRMSNSDIKRVFSNYAICIDEVHNLRSKDIGATKLTTAAIESRGKQQNYYDLIHKFLHTIENKKVILLSGTPMADQPSEIANIMNLLLPLGQQMPTGAAFDREFLIPETQLISQINPDSINKLKQFFRGRVSYLKAIQANIDIRYIGEKVGLLRIVDVFVDLLQDDSIQNITYLKAFDSDSQKQSNTSILQRHESDNQIADADADVDADTDADADADARTGLFHNSQQASIAVFPDGSYGSEGFKRYISETATGTLQLAVAGKGTQVTYSLNPKPLDADKKPIQSLKAFINQNGEAGRLDQLAKISIKFANVVMHLLDRTSETAKHTNSTGSSFVYCNWVKGSGCILFANILEIFGFRRAKGGETDKKLRYGLLTSAVATDNQISGLIETFNQPENQYGEIVNVIIGSKIIGEGISLKNVQDIHILTPHWNFTVTEQALSRAIRAFAHEEIQKTRPNIVVDVYLHTTVPTVRQVGSQDPGEIIPDIDKSIDLRMYEKSEHKDISMKRVEYVMKESAFDCGLNYRRNYRGATAEDGSRECDYGNCQYNCIGWETNSDAKYRSETPLTINELDLSTYRLYYQTDRINNLLEIIKALFQQYFAISYNQLYSMYKHQYTEFELLSALKILTHAGVPLYNRYGLPCYVTHHKNFFYMVNNLDVESPITQQYYTKYPPILPHNDFKMIVERESSTNFPRLIDKFCSLEWVGPDTDANQSTRLSTFIKFPKTLQQTFFETAYIAEQQNIRSPMITWIMSLAQPYFIKMKIKGRVSIINMFGATSTPPDFRLYDSTTSQWNSIDSSLTKQCNDKLTEILKHQESSPYGYYGIRSFDTFYLKRTLQSAQVKGQDCKTMDIWKLYDVILRLNKDRIIRSGDRTEAVPLKTMISMIDANRDIKKMKQNIGTSAIKFTARVENAIKTLYWYIDQKVQKNRICQDIADSLNREGYVIGYYLTTKTIARIPGKTGKLPRK